MVSLCDTQRTFPVATLQDGLEPLSASNSRGRDDGPETAWLRASAVRHETPEFGAIETIGDGPGAGPHLGNIRDTVFRIAHVPSAKGPNATRARVTRERAPTNTTLYCRSPPSRWGPWSHCGEAGVNRHPSSGRRADRLPAKYRNSDKSVTTRSTVLSA